MVNIVTFIVAALATYRLSMALAEEEGPLGMFTAWRGALDPDQTTWLGRGVNCIMCVGFWLALPFAVLITPDVWQIPLVWWGLAGVVVLIRRWEQKR
jgi:hypothetical protein